MRLTSPRAFANSTSVRRRTPGRASASRCRSSSGSSRFRKLGDSELGLVAEAAADLSAPQRILLSVDVDDVNSLLDRVEAAGGHVLGPSTDMPWGQRVAHLHDPDGNMVNLTQPL